MNSDGQPLPVAMPSLDQLPAFDVLDEIMDIIALAKAISNPCCIEGDLPCVDDGVMSAADVAKVCAALDESIAEASCGLDSLRLALQANEQEMKSKSQSTIDTFQSLQSRLNFHEHSMQQLQATRDRVSTGRLRISLCLAEVEHARSLTRMAIPPQDLIDVHVPPVSVASPRCDSHFTLRRGDWLICQNCSFREPYTAGGRYKVPDLDKGETWDDM